MLRALAHVPGVYVPSLYDVDLRRRRTWSAVEPRYPDVPERVEKRTVADLAEWPYPKRQLVPLTEVVHDRLNVEVFRGCTRGCRFCQAGMITRPVRERPAEQVRTMIDEGLRRTGYDEVALTSLSTADFSGIERVVADTVDDPSRTNQVSVSLPSLRVDAFTVGIAAELQKARRTGLTFAPEAGTWRMRQVINKLIHDDDLYGAVDSAFSQGWRRMKLYFLTGLPTETDEDTLGIAELARNCVELGEKHHRKRVGHGVGRRVRAQAVHAVPVVRPEHARGAAAQDRAAARRRPPAKGVQLKWHDPKATMVEGIVSRGDRRLGPVIEDVWRHGGTFQEWSEKFDLAALARRHGSATASRSTGTSTGTATRTRSCRGTTCRPACTRTSSGRTGATPSTSSASRTAAGRPATTAAPAPGYSIEHIVASATPAGRRQPGHRSGSRHPRGAAVGSLVERRIGAVGDPGDARTEARPMRVRFRFSKLGKIRFTSHRDVARLWERALRRAELPVALTEGFSPRPKVHFGLALSTGHESLGEYIDIDFREPECDALVLADLPGLLTSLLPEGLTVQTAAPITTSETSLQQAVTSCEWEIDALGLDIDAAPAAVAALLASPRSSSPGSARATTSPTTSAPTSCSWPSSAPSPASCRRRAPVSSPPRAPGSSPSWAPSPGVSARPSSWPPSAPSSQKDEYAGPTNGSRSTAPVTNRCLPRRSRIRPARRGRRTHRRVRHEKGTAP